MLSSLFTNKKPDTQLTRDKENLFELGLERFQGGSQEVHGVCDISGQQKHILSILLTIQIIHPLPVDLMVHVDVGYGKDAGHSAEVGVATLLKQL